MTKRPIPKPNPGQVTVILEGDEPMVIDSTRYEPGTPGLMRAGIARDAVDAGYVKIIATPDADPEETDDEKPSQSPKKKTTTKTSAKTKK